MAVAEVNQTVVFELMNLFRPDMTVVVDWAFKYKAAKIFE